MKKLSRDDWVSVGVLAAIVVFVGFWSYNAGEQNGYDAGFRDGQKGKRRIHYDRAQDDAPYGTRMNP